MFLFRRRFIVGSGAVALDSWAHGSFILTPIEFLKVNVVQEIGSFYGSHPWHWYLTTGLPTVLGLTTVPFLFATSQTIRSRAVFPERMALLYAISFTVLVFSLLPHKEFRFMLPVLPMCLFISADYLSRWSRKASRCVFFFRNYFFNFSKPPSRFSVIIWLVAIAIVATNVLAAGYLGWEHQKGTTMVMPYLSDVARTYRAPENGDRAKLLFLMPCHSTPFYSHVHQNVTMRFLTCEPNFGQRDNYKDVADRFYEDPAAWIRSHIPVYPPAALPSHVILYESLVDKLKDFLAKYKHAESFFHTEVKRYRMGFY